MHLVCTLLIGAKIITRTTFIVGAAGDCPNNPSPKKGQNGVCPFHRSHREIYTRNRPVSETKFLDDFWGPLSLPAPLFYQGGTKCTFRTCTLFFVISLHCLTLLGARDCPLKCQKSGREQSACLSPLEYCNDRHTHTSVTQL